MKFVELGEHLRDLRHARTGRPRRGSMRVMEIWQGAIECPLNGISEIFYYETRLPSPFYGMFSRMVDDHGREIATIDIHKPYERSPKRRLAGHWKEFVIIKELMHCWSPRSTYVGTPRKARNLIDDLNTPSGPFGVSAASDAKAVLAAAEVILPYATVKALMDQGKDSDQISFEQGLHPEIGAFICRHDIMEKRLRGHL